MNLLQKLQIKGKKLPYTQVLNFLNVSLKTSFYGFKSPVFYFLIYVDMINFSSNDIAYVIYAQIPKPDIWCKKLDLQNAS